MVDRFSVTVDSLICLSGVRCAVVFGSYSRLLYRKRFAADYLSDIDLQFIVEDPSRFETRSWMPDGLRDACQGYFLRDVFGAAKKATILFAEFQVDIVIVPVRRLRIARLALQLGLLTRLRRMRPALESFADLMRYDHLVIKGGAEWARFYMKAVAVGGRLRLSNDDAARLLDIAFADGLMALGKVGRGEIVAAYRILFGVLIETNLRFVQEIRERIGVAGFHRGRRAEECLTELELSEVSVAIGSDKEEVVAAAIVRSLEALARLYFRLSGKCVPWRVLF